MVIFGTKIIQTQELSASVKDDSLKYKSKTILMTFGVSVILSCGTDKRHSRSTLPEQTKNGIDTLPKNNIALKENFSDEYLPVNEYLSNRLKPIRANFKRINSITTWTTTDKKELWETTEDGEATFYYQDGQLEKIITRLFGETFQQLTEYYLLNKQLSLVFEKSLRYNRPMYYDSAAMKDNNDTETFDIDKSEIAEDRSYFENGSLIHQANKQGDGSPFTNDYLEKEQKRMLEDFEKLVNLVMKR